MIEELEKRTKAYFDDEEHSVLDYAIAQIESGEPIAAIARSVASSLDKPISREMLSRYLHETFDNAKSRLEAARPTLGQALAEDSLHIVDSVGSDKGEVAKAALRARTRENLARMFNPEFQPNKQPANVLNIANLHLAAILPAPQHTHARSLEQPIGQTEGILAPQAAAITGAINSTQVTEVP